MNPSTTAAAAVLRAGARAAVGRMCGITARSARRPVVAAVAAGGRSVGGGVRVRAFTACVARREAGEKKAAAPADEAPQKSKIWSFEDVSFPPLSPTDSLRFVGLSRLTPRLGRRPSLLPLALDAADRRARARRAGVDRADPGRAERAGGVVAGRVLPGRGGVRGAVWV